MSMISCSSNIRKFSTNAPCMFYPEKWVVIGNDLDFKDSIYFPSNQIYSSIYLLHNDHSIEFREYVQKKYLFEEISFKISYCRDTTWAKQQILNEIYKTWNVKEIDTVEHQKYYYIYLVDSTKYPKIVSQVHPGYYQSKLLQEYTIYLYTGYYGYVGAILNALKRADGHENVRVNAVEKTSEHIITSYFHLMVSKDIDMYNCPIDEIKRYAIDTPGLDFELSCEKFIPVKIIRF